MDDKKKKQMKKNKKIAKQMLVISLAVFVLLGVFCFYQWYVNYRTITIPSVDNLISEKEKLNFSDKDSQKINTSNYVNKIPEYRAAYNNPNIMGKLDIPGLKISTLVTRGSDNEFYLKHNFYNAADNLGAVFFDYRNQDLSHNRQINIYGHNTESVELLDKLALVNLIAYLDKNMFDNYKDIYLSIDEKQMHYETVAVKIITAADPEHMKLVFTDDTDFLRHAKKLFNNLIYKNDNLVITREDKLLVLQICNYNPRDTYLLVIAKLVK